MTPELAANIDSLAKDLADKAMRIFVKITPEARLCTHRLEEVCQAMRAESHIQLDRLLKEGKESPWLINQIAQDVCLAIAQAGKREVYRILGYKPKGE